MAMAMMMMMMMSQSFEDWSNSTTRVKLLKSSGAVAISASIR
jgi:hypothetical protein